MNTQARDEIAGMKWWNSLSAVRRVCVLRLANSTGPSDAWTMHKNLGKPDLSVYKIQAHDWNFVYTEFDKLFPQSPLSHQ